MFYINYLVYALLQKFFHERLKHLIPKQKMLRWSMTFLLRLVIWNFIIFH